jgi:hypothetical protein
MRATPGEMSTCALEIKVRNPGKNTDTRRLRFMPHLTGKTSVTEGVLSE